MKVTVRTGVCGKQGPPGEAPLEGAPSPRDRAAQESPPHSWGARHGLRVKGPQEAQAAWALQPDTQHLPYLPGGQVSPALSNQVVVLLQTTDVEGNRFLKHPLYSKPVYYSHHTSLGHRALCSRGEGTRDGVRGKQSQALGTSPPSPQPCCSRGRCAREEAPVSCRRGTGSAQVCWG